MFNTYLLHCLKIDYVVFGVVLIEDEDIGAYLNLSFRFLRSSFIVLTCLNRINIDRKSLRSN